MSWIFKHKGAWYHDDIWLTDKTYSGHGEHKGKTASQRLKGLGPIPVGAYIIGSEEEDQHKHGPVSFHLIPEPGTKTYGRGGFMIHPDSIEHPGEASEGCITLPRPHREALALSADRQLLVIPDIF